MLVVVYGLRQVGWVMDRLLGHVTDRLFGLQDWDCGRSRPLLVVAQFPKITQTFLERMIQSMTKLTQSCNAQQVRRVACFTVTNVWAVKWDQARYMFRFDKRWISWLISVYSLFTCFQLYWLTDCSIVKHMTHVKDRVIDCSTAVSTAAGQRIERNEWKRKGLRGSSKNLAIW